MIDDSSPATGDDDSRRDHLRAMIARARGSAALARTHGDPATWGRNAVGPASDAIPGYQLLEELHRGGQGVVYRGIQNSTGRVVAIKVLREGPFAGEANRLRFEREVGILAQLNHRSIIGIIDRGVSAGSHYLVMDYVAGRPLDQFARDQRLDIPARLKLFEQVCDAVTAAHRRGVIHRDLKPANILVDDGGVPRVLDFGLAKLTDDDAHTQLPQTRTGQFIGSLPWASPEQARGLHAEIDIRSDVYSLGVILYQLLTDRLPYPTSGNLEEILATIRTAEPARPSAGQPEIDSDLDAIGLKSLNKEPSQRYQSVGELAGDIRRYLNQEPVEARRDNTWYLLCKTIRKHRGRATIAAAFVVLLMVSAIAFSVLYARSRRLLHELQASSTRVAVESRKSQKLARFAQGMLSGIDPVTAGSLDKRLMRLVLDDASARIDAELDGQPEAEIRITIGKTYQAIGEFTAAAPHLEKALEIRRQTVGPYHPDTLGAMDALAMLYWENDQLADAERICRAALETRQCTLAANHPDRLLSQALLAEILQKRGEYAQAESLARATLEGRARALGPDHAETLSSMNNLAVILTNLKRFDESEPLYRKAIESETRVKGELHPDTLRTIGNLAAMFQESGKLPEAEALERQVLASRQKLLGDDHPDTIRSMGNLALLLRTKGDLDESETLIRKVIEATRRTLGPSHPSLSTHLFLLSSLMGKKGNLADAEKMLREAIAIDAASLPPDHWLVVTRKLGLGACLAKMGRFDESEQLLLAGHAAIKDRDDVSTQWKTSAVQYCVMLYDAWEAAEPNTGKREKAAEWRAKLPPAKP